MKKINESAIQEAVTKNQAPSDTEMRCLEVSESKGQLVRADSPEK